MRKFVFPFILVLFQTFSWCQNEEINLWKKDLNWFRTLLYENCPEMFEKIDEIEFNITINTIEDSLPHLERDVVLWKLSRTLSPAKDARLGISFKSSYLFPVLLEFFDGRYRIIGISKNESQRLGDSIESINGIPITQVADRVCEYRYPCPPTDVSELIKEATLWETLGHSKHTMVLKVKHVMGTELIKLKSISRDKYWQEPMAFLQERDKLLPYQSKKWFWAKKLENQTLYIRYARCNSREHQENLLAYQWISPLMIQRLPSWVEFELDIMSQLASPTKKVILDLRGNWGGNRMQGESLIRKIDSISKLKALKLVTLTDDQTQRAALQNAHFIQQIGGTWIGMPVSVPLAQLENSRIASLPHLQATVFYPKKDRGTTNDTVLIAPDILITPSFNAFKSGEDPYLTTALKL